MIVENYRIPIFKDLKYINNMYNINKYWDISVFIMHDYS